MRKTAIAFTVLVFLAFGAGTLQAQNTEDAKFKKFQDTFWDAYFKFFPTAGSLQGYAKYGDKLEDLSQGAVEKFLESLDTFNQDIISKVDKFKLSPDLQIEHDMMRDFLDMQVLKLEDSVFVVDNPLVYNQIIVDSVRSVMTKNAGNAAARAKLLPGLIKRAKENLKTPPQEYTQAAIAQMPAVLEFYRTEVPKLAGSAAALLAETGKIVAALEDYQRFLQGELLPRSSGNFRTGEAHLKMLRFTTQGNLPIREEIVARSQADYNNIRREMLLVCIPFYKIMYPNIDIEQLGRTKGEEGARQIIIQGVLDKIKGDHVGKDEFLNRIKTAAANVKGFLQESKLLELPEENLQIETVPPYAPGTLWYGLSTPGAYEASGSYTLYVRPLPAEWSSDLVNSFLEEHNNYYVDYLTVQRIYPGIFVPTYFLWRDPSVIKKIAPNRALIMGWPMYLHDMLIKAGFGNFDLRTRLNELKLLLKAVIDFQMDINIHEGTYPKDKVVEYMTRGGFMTQAEAERHWNFIVLNPGEAAYEYIGYQEILDFEKDYRKLKGDTFDSKEFLRKLLSYGAIPLRALKAKLAQ